MGDIIKQISVARMLPIRDLVKLINGAPRSYKVYQIPKRSGFGFRTIAQPTPAVKDLQRWVVDNVINEMPVHPSAMAYRKGQSIKGNALSHVAGTYLLRMDFRDFFNSIRSEDFVWRLRQARPTIDESDCVLLTKILFWRPFRKSPQSILSIGAPSSPSLSNAVMYEFDCAVYSECAGQGVVYTRYADDLTFSCVTPGVLRSVEKLVGDVVSGMQSPKLVINTEKTHHMSTKGRRVVTGLVLPNGGGVSVGRDQKRTIRSMIHHFTIGGLSDEAVFRLKGWLSFVGHVEPLFIDRMKKQYGADVLAALGVPSDPWEQ